MAELTTGQLLAYWRRLTGLSQDALAQRTGLSQARISRIERGKDEPEDYVVEALAGALEIPAQYLAGAPPPEPELGPDIPPRVWALAIRLAALPSAEQDLGLIEALVSAAERRSRQQA